MYQKISKIAWKIAGAAFGVTIIGWGIDLVKENIVGIAKTVLKEENESGLHISITKDANNASDTTSKP